MPAFLYKWLKETSGTGFLRFGGAPNLRAQDGYQRYWLCQECEDRFCAWETQFAAMFHHLTERPTEVVDYQGWLLRFATSLSWRVLLFMTEDKSFDKFSEPVRAEIPRVLMAWSRFLLGNVPGVEPYEQHLIFFGGGAKEAPSGAPANLNRYLLRSIDLDVGYTDTKAFVYAKLPNFIFLGFILKGSAQWNGTRIEEAGNLGGRRDHEVPEWFLRYLEDRSENARRVGSEISQAQREKINEALLRDPTRWAKSKFREALEADLELFEREAFSDDSTETPE